MRRILVFLALLAASVRLAEAQPPTTGYASKALTSATCASASSTGCVILPVLQREGSIGIQLRGTFTATVVFEGSIDGVTYGNLAMTPLAGTSQVTSATGAGVWTGAAAGLRYVRVRVSNYTSGTVNASLQLAPSGGGSGGGGAATASLTLAETDDGSIAAGQTADAVINLPQVFDGTNWVRQSGLTVGSVNATAMALVDDTGAQITSFGGGTQYTEDAAAAANPVGNALIGVRQDTLSATTVSGDGDNIALRSTNKGELYVKQTDAVPVTDNGGALTVDGTVTANLSATDNAVLDSIDSATSRLTSSASSVDGGASLATTFLMAGGTYNSTPLTVSDGNQVDLQADVNGYLKVNVAAGSASGTEYTEDAAAAANPAGGAAILVRADTPATVTSADGDNIAQRGTNYGAAYVQVVDSSGNFVDAFGGSGGTAQNDNSAVTTITGIGALYDTTPAAVTDGNVGLPRMDSSRYLYTVFPSAQSVTASNLQVDVNQLAGAAFSATNYLPIRVTDGTNYLTADTQGTHDTSLGTITSITGGVLGGYANSSAPTNVTAGDWTVAWFDLAGRAHVTGDSSMTALKVDGSGVTQPVSGSVTVSATNLDVQSGGADLATAAQMTTQAGYLDGLETLLNGGLPAALGAGGGLKIDGSGTALPISGSISCSNCTGSGASAVDDAAFTVATDSVAPLGGLFDDTAPDSVNEGDEGAVRMSANRNLYVTLRDAAGNERGLNIDASGQLAATIASGTVTTVSTVTSLSQFGGNAINLGAGATGTGTLRMVIANDDPVNDFAVKGDANLVAHDAADAGNPLKIGYKATTSISGNTMVASNDRTDAFAGIDGVQITRPYSNLEDRVSGTAGITDGSSTSIVAAQGAGIRFCATNIIVSNSSATDVTVDIRDGTAGTILMTIPAPQVGGAVVPLAVPICTTANTIFAADPSGAASTVSVTAVGFKTKL